MKPWTKEEREFAKNKYGEMDALQISKHIGRSYDAVRSFLVRNGVKIPDEMRSKNYNRKQKTNEHLEQIIDECQRKTVQMIISDIRDVLNCDVFDYMHSEVRARIDMHVRRDGNRIDRLLRRNNMNRHLNHAHVLEADCNE